MSTSSPLALRQSGADAGALAHVLLVQHQLDGVRAVRTQAPSADPGLCRNSRVPSVEKSSMMMSSLCRLSGCRATCRSSFITVRRSLYTGMMTDSV